MTDPVLDKIEKLIRLALHNPNIEEARSAALKALQLMDQHQMVVTMRDQRPAPPPPIQPARQPRERTSDVLRYRSRPADARYPMYDQLTDSYWDLAENRWVPSSEFLDRGEPPPSSPRAETPSSGPVRSDPPMDDFHDRAFKQFYERAKARGDARASTGFFDWMKGT